MDTELHCYKLPTFDNVKITTEINDKGDLAVKMVGKEFLDTIDWQPDITDRIYKKYSDYMEQRLVESAFALPKNYIINDGATILFWKDDTKTIVKRSKDEKFDKRLGFLTAYFQKHCGLSKTKANKFLDNLEVKE